MESSLAVMEVEKKALSMVDRAKGLTITSNEEFAVADGFCVALKELEKEIIDHHKDVKEKAWEAHKAAVAAEKKALEPVQEARRIAKGKMGEWHEEQERKRREEEDRLRREAKKKADDEAIAAAAKAEANGDKKQAEAILNTPAQPAPVVLPKATPKTTTTFRTVWKFRVENPNLIPKEYLTPDLTKIGNVIRASQGAIQIPGIVAYSEKA